MHLKSLKLLYTEFINSKHIRVCLKCDRFYEVKRFGLTWRPKCNLPTMKVYGDIMEDYQKRVIAEKEELDGRLARLEKFISSTKFSNVREEEQERLSVQAEIMKEYSEILSERIKAFKLT